VSKELVKSLDFSQKYSLSKTAEFLKMDAAVPGHLYDTSYIDTIQKSRGICWGLCATMAMSVIISRQAKSKSGDSKPVEFIHDYAWFQKSRELLASWDSDQHSLYSAIDKKYIMEFIQLALFAQRINLYFPKKFQQDISTSLEVTKEGKLTDLGLRLVGGVERFFTPRDLVKVLENLLTKKQRFLFFTSKTHAGLIFLDSKGVLKFYDPNYGKSADVEVKNIATEIVEYFSENFPDSRYDDRCYVEIFAYQNSDDKDISFPTPEEIEDICIDKNTADSCGSPDYPYSQCQSGHNSPIFLPYLYYNMEMLRKKTSEKIKTMMLASIQGDVNFLNKMIENKESLDEGDHEQKTMLMYAASYNQLAFLKLLIQKKSDVNAKDAHGNTALMCAVDNADDKVFNHLLDSGADHLAANKSGNTVFDYAVRLENCKILIKLLNHFDKDRKTIFDYPEKYHIIEKLMDTRYDKRNTLLMSICQIRDIKLIEKIINTDFDYDIKRKLILDTLDKADEIKDSVTNETLTNYKDESGNTLLISACIAGDKELVDALIKAGAKVNARNNNKQTALLIAAISGHAEIMTMLLENNADFLLADKNGKTALNEAIKNNQVAVVKAMAAHAIKTKNLLMLNMILRDKTAIIFIKHKAIVHDAIVTGDVAIVRSLLKAGMDKDALDEEGNSPLMLAAAAGLLDIVKILLEFSVDIMQENEVGKTALYYATEYNQPAVVKLLQQKQADLLIECAKTNNIAGMKKLLDAGVPVDARNSRGRTALFYAAAREHVDSVKLLLEMHADPNVADKDNKQPFDFAFTAGNTEISWLLVGGKEDSSSSTPSTPAAQR
jgi:ankyrin repeat protein